MLFYLLSVSFEGVTACCFLRVTLTLFKLLFFVVKLNFNKRLIHEDECGVIKSILRHIISHTRVVHYSGYKQESDDAIPDFGDSCMDFDFIGG